MIILFMSVCLHLLIFGCVGLVDFYTVKWRETIMVIIIVADNNNN